MSHTVPLPDLLSDIGEEFIKWDGRLFRTLSLLLFRPGYLTREYNAGRRVRFVSPFKMYFVVSAVFVFLLSVLNPLPADLGQIKDGQIKKGQLKTAESGAKLKVSVDQQDPLTPTRQAPSSEGGGKTKPGQAEGKQVESDANATICQKVIGLPPGFKIDEKTEVTQGLYLRAYDQWQADPKNVHKQADAVQRALVRGVCKTLDSPGNYASNLIQSIGRTMFFLLPIYALLLAWLFRGARQYYVSHLVLAVNNHTFAFLLGMIVDLVAKQRWVPVAVLLGLSYWLYEFVALRVVYGQRKRLTLFKQFILWQVYGFAILLGFIATVLVTLLLP